MITKEKLEVYLKKGYSYKKISREEDISDVHIGRLVKKYNLLKEYSFTKSIDDKMFFNKIDTKEKAYIAGFILGDGYISSRKDVTLGVALKDKQLIEDISKYIPWETEIRIDMSFDKKTRRFPRVRYSFRSRSFGKILIKIFGNRLASERHAPIVPKHYQKYLLAGFFDADGCITWGYRKDRNRLWQKVSFTASDTILIGIQKILLRYDISSIIRPKKGENVSLIEFANKEDVKKFYVLLPQDGIRLNRKMIKFDELIKVI